MPRQRSRNRAARSQPATRRGLSRVVLFAALCLLCIVGGGGYVALAAWRARAAAPPTAASLTPAESAALAAMRARPHLVFLSTAVGNTYGKVALAPLDAPASERAASALQCDRVYFAGGSGLCLGNNVVGGFLSTYSAYTFGDDFTPRFTFQETGIPSRVRVAADGRLGATTVFVTGHSYAEGGFSTHTTLLDLTDGRTVADLEQFTIWRDGARFLPPDRNLWGVTFTADGRRFYATLGTGGRTYLIEGDVAAREAHVLQEGVECPSLSPSERQIAYKRQVGGDRPHWRLHVLDLATGADTPLTAESRSVDDQVEWLDADHLLYALAPQGPPRGAEASVWVLPLDGGPPSVFLPHAYSPAVVRVPGVAGR